MRNKHISTILMWTAANQKWLCPQESVKHYHYYTWVHVSASLTLRQNISAIVYNNKNTQI